jgi:hypothetical protein
MNIQQEKLDFGVFLIENMMSGAKKNEHISSLLFSICVNFLILVTSDLAKDKINKSSDILDSQINALKKCIAQLEDCKKQELH